MLGTTVRKRVSNGLANGTYDYRDTLLASERVKWNIEDVIGGDKKLDFSKRFMPEALARVEECEFLDSDEKLILNQIRGHAYLSMFGIVEEFIVPFVLDQVRPSLDSGDYRVRAYLQFAGEEVKHIQLFKRFCEEFEQNFATECQVIGPASKIGKAILAHDAMSVALVILMIEWMTQAHYLDSIKDNRDLDAQFRSLLKNHWLEEAQHAKLDARMVESLADGLSNGAIALALDDFIAIVEFLDEGIKQQTILDMEALERAIGRRLSNYDREELVTSQLQANRWTYIGSGMVHPKFLQMLDRLGPDVRKRIDDVAPALA